MKINLLLLSSFIFPSFFTQNLDVIHPKISTTLIDYFIEKEHYSEALESISIAENQENIPKDSLLFITAQVYMKKRNIDSSIHFFDGINEESDLFFESQFNAFFCEAYIGKHKAAENRILNIFPPSNEEKEAKSILYLFIRLLNLDFKITEDDIKNLNIKSENLKPYKDYLKTYFNEYNEIKTKSPLLGGLLSAIVPGLGKFYAGYKRKALATTITVIPLSILTSEILFKDGIKSPKFIISSSIFLIFHIGNIVGSYYSVPIYKQEKINELNKKVYIDIHHIVRRIY